MASSDAVFIRPAVADDLSSLIALEQTCFDYDRLSSRSFRHHIKSEHSELWVAESLNHVLIGYGLVLLHKGTLLARMYSLAVSASARGLGVGRLLMNALEAAAVARKRHYMRLEVAKHNATAIGLYEKQGYTAFGEYQDYYDDHSDALRMHKRIRRGPLRGDLRDVPWYPQSTDFTCGPASLLMAMGALDPGCTPDLHAELDVWREATTIFMTSGHGGCHPLGLALAAYKRGFTPKVWLSTNEPLFLDGVRSEHKKAIMGEVHNQFAVACESQGIETEYTTLSLEELAEVLAQGAMVLILVSTYRLDGRKSPHWVVVTGMDDDCLFVHDPDVGDQQVAVDCQHIPIAKDRFEKMAVFGSQRLRTALVLQKAPVH